MITLTNPNSWSEMIFSTIITPGKLQAFLSLRFKKGQFLSKPGSGSLTKTRRPKLEPKETKIPPKRAVTLDQNPMIPEPEKNLESLVREGSLKATVIHLLKTSKKAKCMGGRGKTWIKHIRSGTADTVSFILKDRARVRWGESREKTTFFSSQCWWKIDKLIGLFFQMNKSEIKNKNFSGIHFWSTNYWISLWK